MKRLRAVSLASALLAAAAPVAAPAAAETEGPEIDALYAELAEPGREDWERIEGEIARIWSRSGSPSMDLLLRRAGEAIEAEEYAIAVEHLTALTDHAPDFAEAWNARATVFYMMGEYALSIADIERTLALNPRHFGALEGLGAILEEMDQTDLALEALRAAQEINPNRPSIGESLGRLERRAGAADL